MTRLLLPALAFALLFAPGAPAAQIVFPGSFSGHHGDIVTLDVLVSQLAVPPGLGAYDLSFTFEGAGLALWDWFTQGALGAGFESFVLVDSPAPGGGERIFRLVEVSLLSPDELYARQTSDFVLLTMLFKIIDPSPPIGDVELPTLYRSITISGELSDALANPVEVNFFIPEPGSGWMVAAASLVLLAARRRL